MVEGRPESNSQRNTTKSGVLEDIAQSVALAHVLHLEHGTLLHAEISTEFEQQMHTSIAISINNDDRFVL